MKYEVWENLASKYNNLWVQKYSLGPTRREVLKIVVPLLKENKKLRILDIGCGTGQLVYEISKREENVNYLGIDVAENMISEAKKNNLKNKNIKFKTIGIEKFNTKDKFDIIICTHAFPYFPNKEEILNKMYKMCNKGANVIIVNSSTNSLKDLIINFFLKATTSKAKYLSIEEMKKLFNKVKFKVRDIRIIREKKYMPTIALFHIER
ncbi:MAG: class I SAM-dependent methyltransferase [Bacilli bacterium]|nr:class I SAM-dependent methyltransferase [Bacilli bacterium]